MTILFLTVSQVLKIHESRITLYGGSHGVRDAGLLESALEMPKQGFGDEYLHTIPFEMAAAYLFHISKNHPFLDGNKRTALGCALIFLEINDYEIIASDDDLENLVLDTAMGKLDKKQIAQFLEENSQKK